MPGAAALCCMAAYRAGAGLVEACVPEVAARAIHTHIPEVITVLRNDNWEATIDGADVMLIGPGLGRGRDVTAMLYKTLKNVNAAQTRGQNVAVVLDADGLNCLAGDLSPLKNLSACVITPHPGEMSRLTGLAAQKITEDPVRIAVEFSHEYGVVTVLKGARTVIASPDGAVYINTTGSAALAKAGSGDALAGIVAGLCAQFAAQPSLSLKEIAALGVYLHGRAGEAAGRVLSLYGANASDTIKALPSVMKRLGKA
jgi:NAD(P)H-hydrate epimerase